MLLELVLCFSILTDQPLDAKAFPLVRLHLINLASELEILDDRELRYVLNIIETMNEDIQLLRNRWRDLKNYPLVKCNLIPHDRSDINNMLILNRAYKTHLENIHILYSWRNDISVIIRECDRLYNIWDCARDVKCEYYYISVRRAALGRYVELVGIENYYQGKFPPFLPE